MLFELSPEQEKMIPVYREKWQKIALSTDAIDRQQAREAVENGYIIVGKKVPEIVFVDSPLAASQILIERLDEHQIKWSVLGRLSAILTVEIYETIPKNIITKLSQNLGFYIESWYMELERDINQKLQFKIQQKVNISIASRVWTSRCSWYDFCISVLEFYHSDSLWTALNAIVSNCGLVFAFEDFCIICDRPRELNFDRDGELSANGKPAIEFADNYAIYAYQGRILPEKYSNFKITSNKQRLEWFLDENDPSYKTILAASTGFLIEEIKSEQIDMIKNYYKKWSDLAFSTTPIEFDRAIDAIENIYVWLDLQKPKFIFCKSPKEIVKNLESMNPSSIIPFSEEEIFSNLINQIDCQLNDFKGATIFDQEKCFIIKEKCFIIENRIEFLHENVWDEFDSIPYREIISEIMSILIESLAQGGYLEFCISVLNCVHESKAWKLYQDLAIECSSWIFPFKDICLVCDRPRILSFDSEDRLHAEGKPAIQFADGFSIYAYHGVILPEKYGKLSPSQWRSQWILSEENAELRRALIQGIGYAKICQELQAVEIDTWQEYSLLKIDLEIDIKLEEKPLNEEEWDGEEFTEEPIYLLKMICPSTGHIHALRVPPNINSAREAITWVNWDIDPEEFSVQT
ncbi:DUF6745 domain-containing protein [Spirulina sp. 06S082]|uniref:DUF6745 domain-containing protein n=1 Tax=Spirulina sp. 06S082 TaxID=3110248 RepID=UPI002B1ECFC0|nr:hypothetical protein [Spirulina sp. 06S082]MEA5469268.1 hypothetical protein [Spirulina sp. 06S082]